MPPLSQIKEEKATKDKMGEDIDMNTYNFDPGYEPQLDIICIIISVLPVEYDTVMEVIILT